MKAYVTVLVILSAFAHYSFAQKKPAIISDFAGMAGCWASTKNTKDKIQSENWMEPLGGTLFGIGRTVSRGKTTGYEYMRIEQRDDGIYFVSRPKENTEDTAFKLIESTGGRFVFENKEHDFPQRVVYSFSATRMNGRIEGAMNGKTLEIDFPMTRTHCS